jgi:hypothetical protein
MLAHSQSSYQAFGQRYRLVKFNYAVRSLTGFGLWDAFLTKISVPHSNNVILQTSGSDV